MQCEALEIRRIIIDLKQSIFKENNMKQKIGDARQTNKKRNSTYVAHTLL